MIREFLESDHDAVVELWRASSGVTVRDVDAGEPLLRYLALNTGLSFVAVVGNQIVGAVLGGSDGRRGYLQHLAVAEAHRRHGIGRELARHCVDALAARRINKCHLMVIRDNDAAAEFWRSLGWIDRSDVRLMSHTSSGGPSA